MKRWHWLILCSVSLCIIQACGSETKNLDLTSSSGSGSSSGDAGTDAEADGCSEGVECDMDGGPFCCSETSLLECVDGKLALKANCSDGLSACDAVNGVCACELGERICSSDLNYQLTCVKGQDGKGIVLPKSCMISCDPNTNQCKGEICISDQCTVDDFTCSTDAAQVLQCQRLPPDNCAQFYPILSCAEQAMACNAPSSPDAEPFNYCVNECGGRGVSLKGKVCDPVENLTCSVLICDGTDTLKPDHIQCKGAGLSCAENEECTSCQCANGVCVGATPALCPNASLCKK